MPDKIPCPCCGSDLTFRQWYEDGRFVENHYGCSCGYEKGLSYGTYYENFPEGYNENGEEIVEDEIL